jgi:hypothetical protein
MSNIEHRILEEIIYDRVRETVNLCQLVIIEQELEESIQRASRGAGVDGPKPAELARAYLQSAWQRLEGEWQTLREDLAHAESD